MFGSPYTGDLVMLGRQLEDQRQQENSLRGYVTDIQRSTNRYLLAQDSFAAARENAARRRLAQGLREAGYAAATAEIERLRVENAVLTAQLETLLAPAAPEGWIVTEGPKELLP